MSRARIAIAGNFHWSAGFSQTVAAYAQAAPAADCEVAVAAPLSRMDGQSAARLPLIRDLGWATHLVFMFENRQFLTDAARETAASFPRNRRAVIDFDGHWLPESVEIGEEPGMPTESWRTLYRELADLVLLPKLDGPLPADTRFFKCFGLPDEVIRPRACGESDYDLQYIGSNWWRWDALTAVVRAAAEADPPLRRIRVCGRWWDGEVCPGHEAASANEPGWLRRHGVEVAPPVEFGRVVAEMGRALISPLLVRPLVAGTGLLTPRMFETLASGSVPVLPAEAEFLAPLYGAHAEHLLLGRDPAAVLGRITADRPGYARAVVEIQDRLKDEYGYRRVLADLLDLFDEAA